MTTAVPARPARTWTTPMPIKSALKSAVTRCVFRANQFAHRARWSAGPATLAQFYRPRAGTRQIRTRFNGKVYTLHVRGDTLDAAIFEQVLCDGSEYRLPVQIEPKIIFDVGANIGASAVYFAARYPNAKVYCFEPLPDNVGLLRKNVAVFGRRVTVVPSGLGRDEGCFEYRQSDDPSNFGGGTFHDVGCADTACIRLPVTTLTRFCRDHRIGRIDVMKIDTEGAEWSVLAGMPVNMLAQTRVVLGELHGVDDWEVFRALTPTHDLWYEKPLGRTCYPFWAVKKADDASGVLRQAA
jgi:FkbM family methyltransferase